AHAGIEQAEPHRRAIGTDSPQDQEGQQRCRGNAQPELVARDIAGRLANIAQARLGNLLAGRDDYIHRRGPPVPAFGRLEADRVPDPGTRTLLDLGDMHIIVAPGGIAHEAVAAFVVPLDYFAGFAHFRPVAGRLSNMARPVNASSPGRDLLLIVKVRWR